MNTFLEQLSKQYPKDEIALVCDGASWHRSNEMKIPENITLLRYDTSLPRPYTRSNAVHGTKGVYMELNRSIYIDGRSPLHQWEDAMPYVEEYEHPLWQDFLKEGVQGGHDGMDYLLMKAFAWSILNEKPFPLDIYDAAAWMAITVLSEQSVSLAGAPIPFPDFTNGKWIDRMEEKTLYSP